MESKGEKVVQPNKCSLPSCTEVLSKSGAILWSYAINVRDERRSQQLKRRQIPIAFNIYCVEISSLRCRLRFHKAIKSIEKGHDIFFFFLNRQWQMCIALRAIILHFPSCPLIFFTENPNAYVTHCCTYVKDNHLTITNAFHPCHYTGMCICLFAI